MLELSKTMTEMIVESGFSKLTCDWTVEMRQGEDILCIVPTASTFEFERNGNRMHITRCHGGVVEKTGITDNFILRNKKLPDVWLKGIVSTYENRKESNMLFDDVNLIKGNPVWLDTFTFCWF